MTLYCLDPILGSILSEISEEQVLAVIGENILPQYKPQKIERITEVGPAR